MVIPGGKGGWPAAEEEAEAEAEAVVAVAAAVGTFGAAEGTETGATGADEAAGTGPGVTGAGWAVVCAMIAFATKSKPTNLLSSWGSRNKASALAKRSDKEDIVAPRNKMRENKK
jgi:hypothetical protein